MSESGLTDYEVQQLILLEVQRLERASEALDKAGDIMVDSTIPPSAINRLEEAKTITGELRRKLQATLREGTLPRGR